MALPKRSRGTHRHDAQTIHLKVHSVDSVFDNRDPDPLPERRLNQEWLEYLFDVMHEKPGRTPLHLSLEFTREGLAGWKGTEVAESLRLQLQAHDESLRRKLKENFREGRMSLVLAMPVLLFFTVFSFASERIPLGILQHTFAEGFLIIGWVAFWKPVEILLYDWWPIVGERRQVKRLLRGRISVKS